MNSKQKAQVRDDMLSIAGFDSVRISKTDVVTVKRGFFYRHGGSAEGCAALVKKVYPTATIVLAEEHWNNWPKDSWWQVEFTLAVL